MKAVQKYSVTVTLDGVTVELAIRESDYYSSKPVRKIITAQASSLERKATNLLESMTTLIEEGE